MEKINNLKKFLMKLERRSQYSHFSKIPHLASCLSCVDIWFLYFSIAKINPKRPKLKSRDKIILSKGQCSCIISNLSLCWIF